jgi:hypothetical protein
MATVAVSIKDFKEGTLPRVCVKTGAPAVANADITANREIGWTWVLLLFGILPFFIARALAGHRVKGYVPMSRRALRRARMFDLLTAGTFVLGIALAAAAAALGQSWLAWTGAVLIGLSVLATIVGTWFVWPSAVLDDEGAVLLSLVHPDFASAALARESAAAAPARV